MSEVRLLPSLAGPRPRRGLRRVPDPEVLAFAAADDRILVSHDFRIMPLYFAEFLMARESSPGVSLVGQHSPISDVIEELLLIWAATEPSEWRNLIVKIPL